MSHNWKRTVCAAAAALIALAGCNSPHNEVHNFEEQAAPAKALTFFGNKYEPGNVKVIEEILTGFMLEHSDVRVSYESLKGAEYYDALEKRVSSGKADDLFMVNHDTALALSQEGRLADLSGLEAIPDFADSVLGQMREPDGSIYWVPTTISAFGLYCNLDLLAAHGRDVPQNLQEWEATCDYFVERGITPIIANNDISLKTLAIAQGFYPLYRDGRQQEVFAHINSGEESLSSYLRPGFTLAANFLGRGYIDAKRALETKKTSDDLEEFAKGEAPFMLTGAWAAGRVKEMGPGFAFQVAPYPVLDNGSVLVVNPDTRLSVNAGSRNQEEALEFISYFLRPENIQKFADNQASFSPMKGNAEASLQEIQGIVDCYRAQASVIGSDSLLDFPVWDMTAEASKRLLAGGDLEAVLGWLDEQVRGAAA